MHKLIRRKQYRKYKISIYDNDKVKGIYAVAKVKRDNSTVYLNTNYYYNETEALYAIRDDIDKDYNISYLAEKMPRTE